MSEIAAWLRSLGLERFIEPFEAAEIDRATLRSLTSEDLKELQIPLGPRKRLLEAIAALADQPAASAAPREPAVATGTAERRQLTVMFVDLVGSTALSARLDPEEMGAVLRGYQNAVAGEVARFEGHVAKFMGDGVLAYFGWPVAHEDEAERAVRAALAVTTAVGGLARPAPDAAPLATRIGIATGLVVVGDLIGEGSAREEAVVGDTPNLAARFQAMAEPGRPVVGETTRRLLGGAFTLADLGAREVKGFALPQHAFAVTGERSLESRFDARATPSVPLIGRDQELALLLERWTQAEAGDGQAVLLVGEAGIGKSRIVLALLDALAAEPHTRIRYQCSPYHTDSALWPVSRQLSHAAGLAADDPPEAGLDKLEALVRQAGEGAGSAAPLLAGLLGLDGTSRYGALDLTPQARRARTLDALVAQLIGLAAQRPVLVLLEDAHWIDPTTLELIALCLDRIATARVLLVLTSRPDRQPALAAHPHVTRLTLNRLGRASVAAIVTRLGGADLPNETVDAIIARTDGVPLFVEELTKAVLETGEAAIPASLHDTLMARLDRIPEVKEVAQIAACIGREFDFVLLAAIAGRPEAELADALDRLAAAELVFRRGTPPDAHYVFKHALVRDAAYGSLLKSRRQQFHARLGATLEERFPETVLNEPELLASHLTAAGETVRAVGYWEQAGARAIERSAFVEAIHHFGKGLELVGTLTDDALRSRLELPLRTGLGDALSWTKGFAAAEVEAAYARAHELSLAMGETERSFRILWGLWHFYVIRGDLARSDVLSEELTGLGRRLADPSLLPHICRTRGETSLWQGAFTRVLQETAPCLDRPLPEPPKPIPGVQDPVLMCLSWQAFALWHLGYPDRACARDDAALTHSRQSPHAGDLGAALIFRSWIRLLRREHETAAVFAAESLHFNGERGFGFHAAASALLLGAAESSLGHEPRALERMARSVDASSGTGAGIFQVGFNTMLAAAHARQGDPVAGREAVARAASLMRRTGERWQEAELHRLQGELELLAGGPIDEAERHFQTALAVARRQEARSPELRTATSLARLWADRGERQRAQDLLAPVHGWFTEGFDLPDLVEAKALLDELR